MASTDRFLFEAEVVLLLCALTGYGLTLLVKSLGRSRPQLRIGAPIAAAACLRVFAVFAVSVTPYAESLRGFDENRFLAEAGGLAATPFGSDASLEAFTSTLHTWIFSLQLRFGDLPETALRVTQIGLAVAGIVLLAVAVHDLAGPRAAAVAGWLMALEPSSIFFNSLLHKESLMTLGVGMVAFGGARIWTNRDFRGLVPIALGCAVAVAARPYAGWFLVAASAAIILHGSPRHGEGQGRGVLVACIVALLVVASVPTVLEASSEENLQPLQSSQTANASDDDANLSLEPINYSSRGDIFLNLPRRIRDITVRPYPWELATLSQQLGLLGTLVVLGGLAFLYQGLSRNRGQVMQSAAPLLYPLGFLLIAYSLSAGNAGTGFRYRTVLVAMMLCSVVALRQRALLRTQAHSTRSSSEEGAPAWRRSPLPEGLQPRQLG